MRKVEVTKREFVLRDEIIGVIEKTVTRFGTSGKVDCPKRYIGKRVYLLICADEND